jgi:hypothetical protein
MQPRDCVSRVGNWHKTRVVVALWPCGPGPSWRVAAWLWAVETLKHAVEVESVLW